MAIDVSVQYNGGFLPEIILLTLLCYFGYYHRGMIPPKCLTIFSPFWGMLRRFRCVQVFHI